MAASSRSLAEGRGSCVAGIVGFVGPTGGCEGPLISLFSRGRPLHNPAHSCHSRESGNPSLPVGALLVGARSLTTRVTQRPPWEKRGDLPTPALSQSLPGGERFNVAAFSQSPAEIRGRREGDSRIAPAGGSCVAGGCGLRWAVVVARGPSSQSSPVGRRGKTAPPLPSLNLSQGERGLMWRLPLGLSQRGEAGGRAIRESPLREVAGFDDPVRGRANACLTRPWRGRTVTVTNICSIRRETVEGALWTRR